MGAQKSSSSILRTPFSRAGDSGSCIWDMAGRVAGILTSGTGAEDEEINDTTYATPIEWLLKDITLKLGEESSSSKKPTQNPHRMRTRFNCHIETMASTKFLISTKFKNGKITELFLSQKKK